MHISECACIDDLLLSILASSVYVEHCFNHAE